MRIVQKEPVQVLLFGCLKLVMELFPRFCLKSEIEKSLPNFDFRLFRRYRSQDSNAVQTEPVQRGVAKRIDEVLEYNIR